MVLVRAHLETPLCDASKLAYDSNGGGSKATEARLKTEGKLLLKHIWKWKNELMKLNQQWQANPLILARAQADTKIQSIDLVITIAPQKLNSLLAQTSFSVADLEQEIKLQRELAEVEVSTKQPSGPIERVERRSREARNLLGLHICDARVLKNRLQCNTLNDLVSVYSQFKSIGEAHLVQQALKDCMLGAKKSQELFELVRDLAGDSLPATTVGVPQPGARDADPLSKLQDIGGSDCLQLVLPMFFHDLRDTSNNWPSLSLFHRIGISHYQVLDICDYCQAFSFSEFCGRQALGQSVDYQYMFLDEEDKDFLSKQLKVPRKRARDFALFIKALEQTTRGIPEQILRLARTKNLSKKLELKHLDPKFF